VVKPWTKFEVCSFSRTEDISWGVKSWSRHSRDPDHGPFTESYISFPKAYNWHLI